MHFENCYRHKWQTCAREQFAQLAFFGNRAKYCCDITGTTWTHTVSPAKAGVQKSRTKRGLNTLDSGFRRTDYTWPP